MDAVKERVEVPWSHPSNDLLILAVDSTVDSSPKIVTPALTATLTESEPQFGHASTSSSTQTDSGSSSDEAASDPMPHQRILHRRHFTKALKEITPSSSEFLGTLADLRRWNEEFGEGRTNRRRQVWGRDRFGFTDQDDKVSQEGRVAALINTVSSPDVKVE